MNLLFLFVYLSFLLWIARNVLFWSWLWQLKEYRLDRMLAHLSETQQGKKLLFSIFSFLKWIIVFGYLLPVIFDDLLLAYQFIIAGIILTEGFFVAHEILSMRLRFPRITLRSTLTICLSLLVLVVFSNIPLVEKYLWLLILDRFSPFFVTFFVYALSVPSDFIKDLQIEKALVKLQKQKNLVVIGISGSYGKSSTKEFVAQILESKYNVLKTRDSHNTPIGVANAVLSGIMPETKFFVVEIGSYKKGEVREICQLVKPTIGISTGISNQHISLFKSLENIIDTEYELIEELPKKGIALFNDNNPYTRRLYNRTRKKKILYLITENFKNSLNIDSILASDAQAYKTSISFNVTLENKTITFKAPLLGVHNIENILPGIYLGHYFGMSEKQIKNAVAHLHSPPKTMIPLKHNSGAMLVDDTFNTSPQAVIAAMSYMKLFYGKKIMVLQPMIELGKEAREEHVRVAKEIGKVCNYLFLTNKNFYSEIQKAIAGLDHPCKVFFMDSKKTTDYIYRLLKKEDVVVFEGKEPSLVLNRLRQL